MLALMRWLSNIALWLFLLAIWSRRVSIFLRKRRLNYRQRHGLCLVCGYDLRATPDRCPECGTIPKPLWTDERLPLSEH